MPGETQVEPHMEPHMELHGEVQGDGHACPPLVPGPEMTISHAAPLREQLLTQLDACTGAWPGLDLSQVEAIDSAGVQLLLALRASLAERQQPWTLLGASDAVRDVLGLYGLAELL